jgi:hypothetical protein
MLSINLYTTDVACTEDESFWLLTHWVTLHPDAPYFSILLCLRQSILLCLTPDDFTHQGGNAGA